MGMNRKYSGFTLVEMLIVMGIIIILMAVGIAAGRFAINRANDVAHQNAADQLFVAAQSFLTDEREYPDELVDWKLALAGDCVPSDTQQCLNDYLSKGEFRGGTDATYYYWTDQKSALVCVSLGGLADVDDRGFYCTGNGFGADGVPTTIDAKEIDPSTTDYPGNSEGGFWTLVQPWINSDNDFGTAGAVQ